MGQSVVEGTMTFGRIGKNAAIRSEEIKGAAEKSELK